MCILRKKKSIRKRNLVNLLCRKNIKKLIPSNPKLPRYKKLETTLFKYTSLGLKRYSGIRNMPVYLESGHVSRLIIFFIYIFISNLKKKKSRWEECTLRAGCEIRWCKKRASGVGRSIAVCRPWPTHSLILVYGDKDEELEEILMSVFFFQKRLFGTSEALLVYVMCLLGVGWSKIEV